MEFWPVLAAAAVAVIANGIGLWHRFGIRRPFSSETKYLSLMILVTPGVIVIVVGLVAMALSKPYTGALAGLGLSVPYWVARGTQDRDDEGGSKNQTLATVRKATDLFIDEAIRKLDGRLSDLRNRRCKEMNDRFVDSYARLFPSAEEVRPCIDPLYAAILDWIKGLTESDASKEARIGRLIAAKVSCGKQLEVRPMIEAAYDWEADYIVEGLIKSIDDELDR